VVTDPGTGAWTTVVVPLSADGRLTYIPRTAPEATVHVQLDLMGYTVDG
jgi:hypothetical protein